MATIFVIGGARRLGAAISVGMAAHGYDVGLTWNSDAVRAEATATAIRQHDVRCATKRADVTHRHELIQALDDLSRDISIPEAIVVNAGVFPPPAAIHEIEETDIIEAMRVNTLPLVTVAKWLYQKSTHDSIVRRIISIGSLGAEQIWNNRLAYNASKAALATAMRSLARSSAPHIAINSVAPGMIIMPEEPSDADTSAVSVASIPMGRYGTSNDVAEAVLFLVRAPTYITGQTIRVDGGHNLVRNS